jgi:hypothetical protein
LVLAFLFFSQLCASVAVVLIKWEMKIIAVVESFFGYYLIFFIYSFSSDVVNPFLLVFIIVSVPLAFGIITNFVKIK